MRSITDDFLKEALGVLIKMAQLQIPRTRFVPPPEVSVPQVQASNVPRVRLSQAPSGLSIRLRAGAQATTAGQSNAQTTFPTNLSGLEAPAGLELIGSRNEGVTSSRYTGVARFGEATNDDFVRQFREQQKTTIRQDNVFTAPTRQAPAPARQAPASAPFARPEFTDADLNVFWKLSRMEQFTNDLSEFQNSINILRSAEKIINNDEGYLNFLTQMPSIIERYVDGAVDETTDNRITSAINRLIGQITGYDSATIRNAVTPHLFVKNNHPIDDLKRKWAEHSLNELIMIYGNDQKIYNLLTLEDLSRMSDLAFIYFVKDVEEMLFSNTIQDRKELIFHIETILEKYSRSDVNDYPFRNWEDYFEAFFSLVNGEFDDYPVLERESEEKGDFVILKEMIDRFGNVDEAYDMFIKYTIKHLQRFGEIPVKEILRILIEAGAVPDIGFIIEDLSIISLNKFIGEEYKSQNEIDDFFRYGLRRFQTEVSMRGKLLDTLAELVPIKNYYDWKNIPVRRWKEIEKQIWNEQEHITQEKYEEYKMMMLKNESKYLQNLDEPKQETLVNPLTDQFLRMEDQRISSQLRQYLEILTKKGELTSETATANFDKLLSSLSHEIYVPVEYMKLFNPYEEESLYNDPFVREKLETLNVIPTSRTARL